MIRPLISLIVMCKKTPCSDIAAQSASNFFCRELDEPFKSIELRIVVR